MSTVSSLCPPADRRSSTSTESFHPFAASWNTKSESRLQRPGQFFAPSTEDVATSISCGWVATASTSHIRLHDTKSVNRSQKIPSKAVLAVDMKLEREEIRDIAISDELLAVVTDARLLVYDEYTRSGNTPGNLIEQRIVDQSQAWILRSVSIAQTGKAALGNGLAYVAVGGGGENGVRVSKYEYRGNSWQALNDRIVLKCPRNIGAIKTVGFSPLHRNALYGPMAFALTVGNHLYAWRLVQSYQTGMQSIKPDWHIDCNPVGTPVGNLRSYRDEITSATFLMSPTGRPYILCTVDHRQGSHLHPSFIVPVDIWEKDPHVLRSQISPIPESILGKNIRAGMPSSNGRYLVVVEKGKKADMLKVLTLKGAHRGGLTCTSNMLEWNAKLNGTGVDISTISISIEEERGALEIIAVDGRGHIAFAKVSVPDMIPWEDNSNIRRHTFELPASVPMQELSA